MKESSKFKSLFAKDRGMPKGANYPAQFEKTAYEKGKKFKNLFKGITVSGLAGKLPKAAKAAKNLGKVATVGKIARAATPIGLAATATKLVYDVATMSPEKKAKVKTLKTKLSKTSTKDYHADLLKMSVGGDTMLKNPKKADLDKDGKLSSYEKKRGKAIEANMKAKKGKMMYANEGKIALIKKLSGAAISDAEAEKFKKMSTQDIRDKLREKKMMKANVGMAAKKVREKEVMKAFKGDMAKGYGAARTQGQGLQDENLIPGKSLDYYKDIM